MSERRRRKKEEDEEDGGRCAQSTRAAGCYNNSTLVAPSLSLFSASLSFSDHPLIVCSPLSFGALCLSIKPPIYPPSTPLSLLHPFSSSFSSSSSSCSGSSSAQRRKTICLTNKSLLPPRERACLSLSPLSLLAFVVLPLSVVGAGRGAVSRCLCQRIQEAKQAALSSFFFPLLSLVFYIYIFLNSNALFFPLALANHSSLIKLLQKSLSMSLDVISHSFSYTCKRSSIPLDSVGFKGISLL